MSCTMQPNTIQGLSADLVRLPHDGAVPCSLLHAPRASARPECIGAVFFPNPSPQATCFSAVNGLGLALVIPASQSLVAE